MPHRPQICLQLCHTRPRLSHMRVRQGSTEGGSVTWSNGTSGERSSHCHQNPAFGHCLPKPALLWGFQMGTQTGTWARSHEDSLEPPGGHLFLRTEREKRGKKQMGREWVLWSSRLQVTQSLTYFWCACITKVLALSHKLSHHAHRESQTRTLSEQRNESGSRKRGLFCLKVIPYLISATFIRLSPWCFCFAKTYIHQAQWRDLRECVSICYLC